MTDQDIIKAVAELDENTACDSWLITNSHTMIKGQCGHVNCHPRNTPPLYLTSRDAIFPVIEKHIRLRGQAVKFCLELNITPDNSYWEASYKTWQKTPRQLCEALLRATGKWVE